MRSRTSERIRTHQMASSLWIKPVDLRTLGRIANPLQDRCFACIRSSDNEHSEPDIWDSGGDLLCSHSTKRLGEEGLAKVMSGPYIIILRKHKLTAVEHAVTLHTVHGSIRSINGFTAIP